MLQDDFAFLRRKSSYSTGSNEEQLRVKNSLWQWYTSGLVQNFTEGITSGIPGFLKSDLKIIE